MLGLWWAVLSHCFSIQEPGLIPGSRAQPPAPPQDWPSQVQEPPPSLSPWDSWWWTCVGDCAFKIFSFTTFWEYLKGFYIF